MGQPLCIHSATPPPPPPPPHPASFGHPVSDHPPRRPLCNCFEHTQNFTTTMAFMALSEHHVCHLWTTKATSLPPLSLRVQWHGQSYGRARAVQMSHTLCEGGITMARSRKSLRNRKHGEWDKKQFREVHLFDCHLWPHHTVQWIKWYMYCHHELSVHSHKCYLATVESV